MFCWYQMDKQKFFLQLWTVNNGNGRRLGIEHYELSRRQHRTIISPLFPTQNIAMAVRVCKEDISCNMMIKNMFSNLEFFCMFLYICWRLPIWKHVRVFLFHERNWSHHTIIIKIQISHAWVIAHFSQNFCGIYISI